MLHDVMLWLHLMLLTGAFGGLFFSQFALPREIRDSDQALRSAFRMASLFLIVGMVPGVVLFVLRIREAQAMGRSLDTIGSGTVLIKFLIWLVVAACFMTGAAHAKKGRMVTARSLRTMSLVLMAVAAFLGVIL